MSKLLARFEQWLAGVFLAGITLLIVAQLILGQVAPRLSSPLTTVVLAFFVWATMLAVPAATRHGSHLSLVLLRRWVPASWRGALRLILLVATLAFFVVLAATGTRLCLDQMRWGNRFVGASWPAWLVTISIPIAAGLSCVRAFEAWWAARRGEGGEDGREA